MKNSLSKTTTNQPVKSFFSRQLEQQLGLIEVQAPIQPFGRRHAG